MADQTEARVGVYICHCGGNISDVVDVKQVAERIGRLPGVVVARTHMFMCSDPGQQLIQEDIEREGLNRIVVASCSPRLHEMTFRNALKRAGLNPYLYEHANIREQVSWVTHGPQATEKATHLVAAAVGKARALEGLEPIRVDALPRAVVVGGGISGLKATRDLAAYGISVTLIEKSPFLGGHMSRLGQVYPTGEEAQELLAPLIQEVVSHPNVEVLTNAEVVAAQGYVGNFRLSIRQRPRGVSASLSRVAPAIDACPVEVENEHDYGITKRKAIYQPYQGSYPPMPAIDWQACNRCGKCAQAADAGIDLDLEPTITEAQAGVIVTATGFEHYEPSDGEYGYRQLPEVITLPQLISLMKRTEDWGLRTEQPRPLSPQSSSLSPAGRGAPDKPSGSLQGRVLRWNGRPVRSIAMIHCVGSRQIEGIHEPADGKPLNEYCSRVCCTATLQAANEIRDLFPEVQVFDFYRDIRTYGRGHEEYYENAAKKGVLFFRFAPEDPPVVERAEGASDHPVQVRVKDRLSWGEEVEVPVDLVVLATGMVPGKADELISKLKLPVGSDGYLLEVHPKLRPVEVAVNGVLLAGTCQGPKDITESAASASASAAKAATILSKGYVELDPFVATVDPDRCDGCGECAKVCGYEGTVSLVERAAVDGQRASVAEINPALCKGCGACVAVCPRDAVDLKGWTLKQFDAMVDALVSEELVKEGSK